MANNIENRMKSLKEFGIETGNYFSIQLPEGLKPGSTISVMINEQGEPVLANNTCGNCYTSNDNIENEIMKNGYVRNTKLHRRWVMAQMFRALNYKGHYGQGYNDYINNFYNYKYQFNMTQEEIRVIGILQKEDKEAFEERSLFFNFDVVYELYKDYLKKLEKYVDGLPRKRCKGVPYVTFKSRHIFESDISKKIYEPVKTWLRRIMYLKNHGNDYAVLYREMAYFNRRVLCLLAPNTMKSSAWKDAYKGAGAYYTLKNMIMYHECWVKPVGDNIVYYRDYGLKYVRLLAESYKGEYWRLFAFMKKTIEDNKFDFHERMNEIYKDKYKYLDY